MNATRTLPARPVPPVIAAPLPTAQPPSPGALWLANTSSDPGACLATWRAPHAFAPVHVADHTPWDVIRVEARLGTKALRVLAADNAVSGPVLASGLQILFWVPRLTVPWDRLLTGIDASLPTPWNWGSCLTAHIDPGSDRELLCPEPGKLRRKDHWINAPDGSGDLMYAGVLASALDVAYGAVYADAARITEPTEPHPPSSARPTDFAAFIGSHHPEGTL